MTAVLVLIALFTLMIAIAWILPPDDPFDHDR